MTWDKETIALIGALSVAIITLIGNIISSLITKRYEFKKALYSTIFDYAYKEWELKTKQMLEDRDKHGKTAVIYPFDMYLIYYSQYIRIIEKNKLQEKDVEAFKIKLNRLLAAYEKHARPSQD